MTATRIQVLARNERYHDEPAPVCLKHAIKLAILHDDVDLDAVVTDTPICWACNVPEAPREFRPTSRWDEPDDDRLNAASLADVSDYLHRYNR